MHSIVETVFKYLKLTTIMLANQWFIKLLLVSLFFLRVILIILRYLSNDCDLLSSCDMFQRKI